MPGKKTKYKPPDKETMSCLSFWLSKPKQ